MDFADLVRQGAPVTAKAQAVGRIAARGAGLVSERLQEARVGARFRPRQEDSFVVAAYFAGDEASVYQLEQWLWSFERLADRLRTETGLAEPFGILARSVRNAQRIAESTWLPVRFSRLTSGLDAFMGAPDLRVVFYVNQATQNFQALRFPRPAHVHLSHGESEKISMISNQLKAYDRVFTAGAAARHRLLTTLVEMPEEHLLDVGRPQLDAPREVPPEFASLASKAVPGAEVARQSSPLVFFAPTWEGDSPAMAYGTLAEAGERLVTTLLEADMRVLYRPHPRTGWVDPAFAKANARIMDLVAEAPGSAVDTSAAVGWQFDVADACVAEMSSVAFDWLTTHKPLVMLRPVNPQAEVLQDGLFDRVPTVQSADADAPADVVELLRTELAGVGEYAREQACEYYLGDTSPGAQQRRFEDRTLELIALRAPELEALQQPE